MAEHRTSTLLLVNERPAPLRLILEPWGNECVIEPGSSVHVVDAGGDDTHPLELHVEEDGTLVFYGRAGSVLSAYRDGEEVA